MSAILAALAVVPRWVWGLVAALVVVGGIGWYAYNAGQDDVQEKWDASVARGKAEVERLQNEAGKITIKTEVQTVERIKVIHEKGDEIVKVREVFVPTDSGMLTGGFRLYFDAAVENRVPNAAEIPNAAPVAIKDVADTVAYNFEQCHVAYETVEAWQHWAAEQCKLNDKGCPPLQDN